MFSRIAQQIWDSEQVCDLVEQINNTRWRPSSLVNLMSPNRTRLEQEVLSTTSETFTSSSEASPDGPEQNNNNKALLVRNEIPDIIKEFSKRGWSTIVTLDLVEAKSLPDPPDGDGSTHNLYCKIRLGSETCKSKAVQSTSCPEWRESFTLHLNKDHVLRLSLWDKGKQKNFMGSCVIDLSNLQKERTHDMWQDLEDGFGSIHLNVTMCVVRDSVDSPASEPSLEEIREKYSLLNLDNLKNKNVGQLRVKVVGARGLSGRPNAYCTLQLDNEKVQTHCVKSTSEPMWNKSYVFNVHDVSSTLDLKMFDNSIVSTLTMDLLGKVSIPLLRIQNGESRWYALKDRSKRGSARGNCPRVLLEMTLIYNPIKAGLRLFQPPEMKYVRKKTYKFDLALVYSNLVFVKGTFDFAVALDKQIRQFLEWDNRELSTTVLVVWLVAWYLARPWSVPLLLLMLFVFFWFDKRKQFEKPVVRPLNSIVENGQTEVEKAEPSLGSKIQGLPELSLVITQGIEYLESVHQRIVNLVTFKVPFYSYMAMILLASATVLLYFVPFNYLMMLLGIYKYSRKYLNPDRILNHDMWEFLTRVPDNEILKDWEELSVPEPHHYKTSAGVLVRSHSTTPTQ